MDSPAVEFRAPPVSPSAMSGTWVVAQVKSQHEKAVASALNRADVGYFLPTYEVVRRYERVTRRQSLPLFPCYLSVCAAFVIADEEGRIGDAWLRNLITRHGGKADSLLRLIEVKNQRRFVHELDVVHATGGKARPYAQQPIGTECRITAGPLRGATGRVVENGKLVITVITLGGAMIDVEPDLLEPVE